MAEQRSEAGWVRYLVPWPLFPLVLFVFQADYWTWKFAELAVISSDYGSQAYAAGLRVVNSKQGVLSDGRVLSGGEQVVLNLVNCLLCVPLVIGAALGLAWINMRFHGKRWRDVVGSDKPIKPLDGSPM